MRLLFVFRLKLSVLEIGRRGSAELSWLMDGRRACVIFPGLFSWSASWITTFSCTAGKLFLPLKMYFWSIPRQSFSRRVSINNTKAAVTHWAEQQEVGSRDFHLHSQNRNLIKDISPGQIDELTNARQAIGSDTECCNFSFQVLINNSTRVFRGQSHHPISASPGLLQSCYKYCSSDLFWTLWYPRITPLPRSLNAHQNYNRLIRVIHLTWKGKQVFQDSQMFFVSLHFARLRRSPHFAIESCSLLSILFNFRSEG